jgi:hypothetical protein
LVQVACAIFPARANRDGLEVAAAVAACEWSHRGQRSHGPSPRLPAPDNLGELVELFTVYVALHCRWLNPARRRRHCRWPEGALRSVVWFMRDSRTECG